MLVAFALQGYITQTHIHFGAHAVTAGFVVQDENGARASAEKATGASHDQGTRNDQDPDNCPICQEILYAGHYVAPAIVPILLPSLPVSTIAVAADILPRIAAPSHNWQGRGPPQA